MFNENVNVYEEIGLGNRDEKTVITGVTLSTSLFALFIFILFIIAYGIAYLKMKKPENKKLFKKGLIFSIIGIVSIVTFYVILTVLTPVIY